MRAKVLFGLSLFLFVPFMIVTRIFSLQKQEL